MLNLAHYPNTFGDCAALFFALLIGHALGDYPLQGEFLALHKDRNYQDPVRHLPKGLWVHCLFAHSLIHAGCVWFITGRVFFGDAPGNVDIRRAQPTPSIACSNTLR